MKLFSSRIGVTLLAFFWINQLCAGIAVIGNSALAVSSIGLGEVSRIYLGKTSMLSDGTYVIPIDQQEGSSAREIFYNNVIKMNDIQLKAYWSRVIFTGKGQPPQQESSDSAVKELILQNPSFIGYIDESAVDGHVKVLAHFK